MENGKVQSSGRLLADQAYETLRDLILRNQLPPGHQALETELAEQLAMSRTPVREALVRLQRNGLIELTPRHGLRVLPISPVDLREIYQLLCCLEATAAELMAGLGLALDSPEIKELESANQAMRDALDAGDLMGWASIDELFHRLLVEGCGNRRLQVLVEAIWDQAHRARMLTMPYRPLPRGSLDEHRAVIEAIARGDTRVAYEIHFAHRRRGMNLILGIIEKHQIGFL